jgi:hypothetical protein
MNSDDADENHFHYVKVEGIALACKNRYNNDQMDFIVCEAATLVDCQRSFDKWRRWHPLQMKIDDLLTFTASMP